MGYHRLNVCLERERERRFSFWHKNMGGERKIDFDISLVVRYILFTLLGL